MGLRLLALACLVGAAFAGPFQRENRCATQCKTTLNPKFSCEPGKKHVYEYRGVNYLSVAGHKKQKASISGTVELHSTSKCCEIILQMKDIRIDHKASHAETAELRRKFEIPMSFASEDGVIKHVCPSPEETTQSQNIKKGILSAFLNSMSRLDRSQTVKEDDSLGTCVTKYTVKPGRALLIEKEKDLKSCTKRHTSVTSLITNPYESESDIQTLPIFDEKLVCKQVIENKIMQKVNCREYAKIKPLKKHDSLIEFEGEIDLKLKSIDPADKLDLHAAQTPESLQYNLEDSTLGGDRKMQIEDILRRMCSKSTGFIDMTVSKDFFMLVSLIKQIPYESLEEIYRSLETGSLCSSKKVMDIFLDALPMAGTGEAIQLMVKVLVEKKVTGFKAKLWALSLALVPHPTSGALHAVVPLLKKDKSSSVLLGVSAMVHRYCKKHNCVRSSEVREIVSEMSRTLGRQCSSENETEVVAVLKALGNIGYLGVAESNVLACAKDSDKSIRLRLAAIDAFRLVEERRPESLLSLYTSTQEHFEVRIAALSSVLKRADWKQLKSIKAVAERESDVQVNAFTSTLISNVNKTSSPLKKNVHRLLQELELKTPKVGYLENSKNVELSYYSEHVNVGASVEADIIHAPKTKIPRSITSRFDLQLFGKHVNVFEVGVRAEGLEKAIKKILGLNKQNKQRSSWNFLRSSNEDSESEASVFFRTMDIEVWDLSISDVSGMGQMFKFADVLNKMSHEKSADFSHSFLFMNSKLVIPSVTGRSYSFGLTGSATVALTAKSRVDILDLLSNNKNCDIYGHFQPSVNVEITAAAGIQSTKHRPDIKVITRLHSESDMEARFRVKDGHMALASVSMPSENIALAKISSEVVEVDEDHSEKPVYQDMQKKIDYCFNKMDKPLGISVCGKWEVPRPFLSKTFPYIKGVGNVEISLKKSDLSMKGYELSFEIPKRRSQHMKFKASLDTPGSQVNRRFSADLEVQNPTRGQHELSLRLQSPFKNASGSGSLTIRDDLIDGSLEFHSSPSRRYSLKASTSISSTPSQKIYKPSVAMQLPSSQPVTMEGTISISKGRKQQIGFEIKSNKPSNKPLLIKGTLTREGRISLSKEAEWKVSSDVAVRSPLANLQLRAITEKQAKQAQTVSTSWTLDYQRGRSQKQSVKLTGKLQKSSGKVSSYVQYQMTQYPSVNWALKWNMQGKLKETLKNDITLMYGRDPENTYVNILHSSRFPDDEPGECNLAVKAPQFNLDSELKVSHEIKMSSKVHVEADLRYKEDKHVKGLIHLEKPSDVPLKLKMKVAAELPTRKIEYTDEIEETSPNAYEGNAAFQWKEGKRAELKYKFSKASSHEKIHHEFESALRLPGSQSAIKNKASLEMSDEGFSLEGRLSPARKSEYSFKVHLNKIGASHIGFKLPKAEGDLKLYRERQKRAVELDLKLKESLLLRRDRRITAHAGLGWGEKKHVEAKISWDNDRDSSKMLSTSLIMETQRKSSGNTYSLTSNLQMPNVINIDTTATGDIALLGSHEATINSKVLNFQPVGFVLRHSMTTENIKSHIKMSKNSIDKAELSLEGLFRDHPSKIELTTSASLKSLDNSFESKSWSSEEILTRTDSSLNMKSKLRLEISSGKVYESECSYEFQPNLVALKGYLSTPHVKFEKQALGFTFRRSEGVLFSSATVEFSNGKELEVTTETKKSENELSARVSVKSPFDKLQTAEWQISYEKHSKEKSIKSNLDVNGKSKAEVEVRMVSLLKKTEIQAQMKSAVTPELSARVIIEKDKGTFRYSTHVMKGSSTLLSTSISKQSSQNNVEYSLLSKSLEQTLLELKLSKAVASESISHVLEAKGPFSPVSLALEISRKRTPHLTVSVKACREDKRKECYIVKAKHTAMPESENTKIYKKLSIVLEKSEGRSSSKQIGSATVVLSVGLHDFREEIIVKHGEKRYGYEIKFHRREHKDDHCSIDGHFFMPHRTLSLKSTILHNEEHIDLDFELLPDTSVPTRRLSFELKKESSKDSRELAGSLSMIYPGMENPVLLTGRVQRQGLWPVSGKVEVHYPSSHDKVWTLELVPETDRRSAQKSVVCRLYREDKTVDVSVRLTARKSQTEDVYIYERTSKTPSGEEKKSLRIALSEKKNGIPHIAEISYVTPSSNIRVKGRARAPTDLTISVFSKNEQLYELEMKAKEGCVSSEHFLKSDSFIKTTVCFNKKENSILKIVDIQGLCHNHECFHAAAELDPETPHLANIVLNWDKRELENSLKEVRDIMSVIEDHLEIREKLVEIFHLYMDNILKPLLRDLKSKISDLIKEHFHKVRGAYESMKKLKFPFPFFSIWDIIRHFIPYHHIVERIIYPIVETFSCVFHRTLRFVVMHMNDIVRFVWNFSKNQFVHCLKSFCAPGTFCHDLALTLERHGVKKASQLLQKKVSEVKSSALQQPRIVQWIIDVKENIKQQWEKYVTFWKKLVSGMFFHEEMNKLIEKVRELEKEMREKATPFIHKWIRKLKELFRRAEKDQDFKVLKELVLETKDKAVSAWERKEDLLHEVWAPLRESLLEEYPRKWVRDRVEIQEFSPKRGQIKIKFHHPLNEQHIQVLKNAVGAIKNKVL